MGNVGEASLLFIDLLYGVVCVRRDMGISESKMMPIDKSCNAVKLDFFVVQV